MAVKKAIAVIASENQTAVSIIYKLAAGNYRLLLISKDKNPFTKLAVYVKKNYPNAELIIQDCAKDGCWEADIIILAIDALEVKEVAAMIKEVATQKIVVVADVNEKNKENILEDIKILLQHSKVASSSTALNTSITFLENGDKQDLQKVLDLLNAKEINLENTINQITQKRLIIKQI